MIKDMTKIQDSNIIVGCTACSGQTPGDCATACGGSIKLNRSLGEIMIDSS